MNVKDGILYTVRGVWLWVQPVSDHVTEGSVTEVAARCTALTAVLVLQLALMRNTKTVLTVLTSLFGL